MKANRDMIAGAALMAAGVLILCLSLQAGSSLMMNISGESEATEICQMPFGRDRPDGLKTFQLFSGGLEHCIAWTLEKREICESNRSVSTRYRDNQCGDKNYRLADVKAGNERSRLFNEQENRMKAEYERNARATTSDPR